MPRSTLVLAAVGLTAAGLAGCGLAGTSSGVATVDSDRLPEAPRIVVTLPPDDPPAAGSAEAASSDVEEVDTLVEPEVRVRPSTIAVVGDSLTLSAEDELIAALEAADLDVVAIDAQESRRMTNGTRSITPGRTVVEEILVDDEPELWVIALGTNDVASVESLTGFRDDIRSILDLVPAGTPVVWVDLYIRDRPEPISRANLQIRAELGGRDGGTAVVDWFSQGEIDGLITGDGVHLTDQGQQRFADSIVAAVDELFPRP